MKSILDELSTTWKSVNEEKLNQVISQISNNNGRIVGLAAGRMGYSLQAFIMRLSHLGYPAYMLGDTSLPRIGEADLVLVNSSSGETESIVLLTKIAKKAGATIILISASPRSTLKDLADYSVIYNVVKTDQLMKTVYEQFSYLLFDLITFRLVSSSRLTSMQIENNHSILE